MLTRRSFCKLITTTIQKFPFIVDGIEHTEESLNGFPSKDIPDVDELNGLLESVDLTTFGLERVKLNQPIPLDDQETSLEPVNPNMRGFHEEPEDKSPLDEIIRVFNERWFSAWDATPEEQRIKLINILRHVKKNDKYESQVVNNHDEQNRRIALESLIGEAINRERRRELDLYKLYAGDAEFKKALNESIMRILDLEIAHPSA